MCKRNIKIFGKYVCCKMGKTLKNMLPYLIRSSWTFLGDWTICIRIYIEVMNSNTWRASEGKGLIGV